jgi:hypothetical protein
VYLKESLIELARFQERTKAVLDYKLEQLERSKRRSREEEIFDIIEESEKAIKRSWTRCLTPLLPRGIIWKQSKG